MLPSFQRTKNQLNPTGGCGDRSVLKFSEILRTNDESAIFFSSFSRIPENFGGNIMQNRVNFGFWNFEKFALYYFSNFGFWKFEKFALYYFSNFLPAAILYDIAAKIFGNPGETRKNIRGFVIGS